MVVGKYVIQRKLAEGGMAEIFLATAQGAEGFEKPVVIKRIRSGLANDTSFVEMFIAEARLASRLSHPNLVHIFDFDRHEDSYYLAMEYIRGRSLLEAHKRASEVSAAVAPVLVAQIGVEIARGLGYAHRLTEQGKPLNLVHRDVTPHNVLLSYDGAVKLTDFGIAKAGGRATAAGMLKGKFAYMAPEQARGEPVDARTDLFSLGITLWELLTGARLFEGDTDMAVLRAVQERPVLAPAELNPGVGGELSGVIVKALERVPANRFQTAAELERALLHYVRHHSEDPDEIDVGAFVRDLFPVESRRAEAPVSAQPGSGVSRPARDVSTNTVPQGEALAARPAAGHPPLPPDMLSSEAEAGGKTLLSGSQPSYRRSTQSTQPSEGSVEVDDGPTVRRPAPRPVRPPRPAAPPLSARLTGMTASLRPVAVRFLGQKPWVPVLFTVGLAVLALIPILLITGQGASPPAQVSPPKPAAVAKERPVVTSPPAASLPALAPAAAPTPAVAPAPVPPAVPSLASPVAPATAEPAAGKNQGVLELTLTPKGNVTIDGKASTPVEGLQRFVLPVGRHEVTATDSKIITSWTVVVRPGLTVKKRFVFRRHK
jgi:eukaryotic-like serine/threonine-protein kinase